MNFKAANLGIFDYKNLMSGIHRKEDEELKQKIIEMYHKNDQSKRFMEFKPIEDDMNGDNLFPYAKIREEHLSVTNDLLYIVDVLVEYLYFEKNSKYKVTLWSSFGDVIINNLKRNISENTKQCECCGKRIEISGMNMKYCSSCSVMKNREKTKERVRNFRNKTKNKYV
ncbi:hypothetical protein [Paenibacillus sp. FSL H3-0333]|uniref:hypothetical protein n=1 Tax=Paenibacillus sp. FSL H3-0333 TaxID=2921373 RepID=UPI0030F74C2F